MGRQPGAQVKGGSPRLGGRGRGPCCYLAVLTGEAEEE